VRMGRPARLPSGYMNEVNLEALANQATRAAKPPRRKRRDPIRFGRSPGTRPAAPRRCCLRATRWWCAPSTGRSSASSPRLFQVAIIDVDSGLVITTATSSRTDSTRSVAGRGTVEWRFARVPLRPRQYVLRLSITDYLQLASYDVVTAGPRFAISGGGQGVDGLADEEDGLVSLPYEFHDHGAVPATERSGS